MTPVSPLERLQAIAERLRLGGQHDPITVREFLSWFSAKRRGVWVVTEIRATLSEAKLLTDPDFESTYIDGLIQLRPEEAASSTTTIASTPTTAEATGLPASISATPTPPAVLEYVDPTHRISKLAAANNPPTTVNPDSSIQEAITLMLSRGFSQLPVMSTPRKVQGVVSWSSIGARLGTGATGTKVSDMLEQHHVVSHDASIFQAIPIIVAHDYVLVQGRDSTITGIVTASDLSLQFLQLSEPFLLLSEIENQIRQIISKRFKLQDLESCRDPADVSRTIERVSDLTFGEYIRLLENPDNWTKSSLPLDRVVFCRQLSSVRDIRNDVMHFDPDGISPTDVEELREFARFLQRLATLGIS